jgi:CheY-like chemotaxis protein
VVGYFDIALESNLSEQEQQTLMTNARDASSMLLALLSDLLDVARLNAGRVPLSVHPFDLREVVRLSIVSTSAAIRRRPISVVSAIDSSVPQRLTGDAGRVRQIIVNLVSNAIKVMTRGTVVVQASYRRTDGQGWLDLSVIDDGPGISLAQQQTMFERFSRVTELTGPDSRPGVKGWGLGLSISASLVGLMQGTITARSELGQGAAFSMSLPLAPAEAPFDPIARDTHVTTLGRQDVSVLIVDDMPMNLLVLGKMLESLGCQVTLAEHGLDAVRYCSERRFDLVMMDVDMAEMDGVDATRHIRALDGAGATVPIIAVTGFASAEQVARMLAAGMNEHALKPMRKATAAQLLAKWVPHCASLQDMTRDAHQRESPHVAAFTKAGARPPVPSIGAPLNAAPSTAVPSTTFLTAGHTP